MGVASFQGDMLLYLNDHSCIEQQLNGAKIGFRRDDNAFLVWR